MTRFRYLLATLLVAVASPLSAGNTPKIAIIIDDLGYELAAGQRVVALPGPVACAILPDAPRAGHLAGRAHASGKEVLLHLPMQAVAPNGPAEPASITLDMSRDRFAETFATALAAVPHAIGVNNHRGSLVTRHPGHMQWLMEEIRARDALFFVDSYTTHHSIALQIADESGVSAVKRDVFLDYHQDAATVEREFDRLKRLAQRRGYAVAIGHPYPATLELLERELPRLQEQGFELVPISNIVTHH